MNFKKVNLTVVVSLLIFGFLVAGIALAQPEAKEGLGITAERAGIIENRTDPAGDIPTIIGLAINYVFGPIATIFVIFILIGGYQWMAAKGNEERIAKSKKFIINAVFGLLVIFTSWGLVWVITGALTQATVLGPDFN